MARKMHHTTRAIRKIIGHIDGAWVRVYRDGTIWVGQHSPYARQSIAPVDVRAALETAGYHCEAVSERGTSGEHVLAVKPQ